MVLERSNKNTPKTYIGPSKKFNWVQKLTNGLENWVKKNKKNTQQTLKSPLYFFRITRIKIYKKQILDNN